MTYKTLAALDFNTLVFEASAQTRSGQELLSKYQSFMMANPVTCKVVNNFMNEARSLTYDNGICTLLEKVATVVNENKYGWAIATACEQINENGTEYNFLARNAAKQAERMLTMNENDIVTYVKAGALRNVQYVPQFRNIAKAIFTDHPVVENYQDFTVLHPISIVEKNNDKVYFEVLGNLYCINEGNVTEALWSEVSNNFKQMTQFMESNKLSYDNESLTYKGNNFTVTVSEAGKCVYTINDKKTMLTTEQLRERNNMYLTNIHPNARRQMQYDMEMVAKVTENFDNIAILNNAYIIYGKKDNLLLIENEGNAYARMLKSTHSSQWSVNKNIYETVEFIKEKTRMDLTEMFHDKINNVIEKVETEKKAEITESLKQDEIKARREKIEKLIESNKNNPTMLAVLSKVALELNDLEK